MHISLTGSTLRSGTAYQAFFNSAPASSNYPLTDARLYANGHRKHRTIMTEKTASRIPVAGMLVLFLLCFLWGANVVAIKISITGVPPLLTATLRSSVATILLVLYCRMRGYTVFIPKNDIHHAVILGGLFALDFLFLYWGNQYTHASRAVIFLYTQPFWTALGVPSNRRGNPGSCLCCRASRRPASGRPTRSRRSGS